MAMVLLDSARHDYSKTGLGLVVGPLDAELWATTWSSQGFVHWSSLAFWRVLYGNWIVLVMTIPKLVSDWSYVPWIPSFGRHVIYSLVCAAGCEGQLQQPRLLTCFIPQLSFFEDGSATDSSSPRNDSNALLFVVIGWIFVESRPVCCAWNTNG